jgi:hypothetical protein
MATSTQVDAILRDDYREDWDQLNNACWLLAQIETKRDTVQGRIARHVIHTGRSGGIGARREGVALPAAGRQRHSSLPIPVRWNTARIQLTVQLMNMAKGEPGAFVDALESEMGGIKKDAMRDINRQLFGTSNGVIATCGTTTTSATIVLATTTTAAQMRHLYVGRFVDVGTVASPQTVASNREITAVDTTNKTITVSGATMSTTGSHFIFNYNSGGASDNSGAQEDGQSECTGLQTILSNSATLHTLTVASVPVWKANVYANSGTNRPISDTLVDYALLDIAAQSGESPDMMVSNIGVFVQGKGVLSAYQRNLDTVEMKGGFTGIRWNTPGVSGSGVKDLAWTTDFDSPANRLELLNSSKLVCHQIAEGWQWMDDDGAVLSRVPDQLAYEAVLYTSMELGCVQRNAHGSIQDLAETTA